MYVLLVVKCKIAVRDNSNAGAREAYALPRSECRGHADNQ